MRRGGTSCPPKRRLLPFEVGVLVLLAVVGCAADPREDRPGAEATTASSPAKPGPTSPPPATRPPRPAPYSTWPLGKHVLPRRPDGFGVVRRTPRSLMVRRYPTTDLLPSPADGRFHSSIRRVTPAVRARMGETWQPGCPVALERLRYVTVTFRGFDGEAHTGELVLRDDVAADVVGVFRRLFRTGFPIEEMRLPTTADLHAPPTGDGNNTAGTVCRTVRGSSTVSAHALGLAIDVNPFLNPYQKGDLVLPERASAYLDRGRRLPGMIRPDGVVVRAFAAIGWTWGGSFRTVHDYMHFSATGR